MTSPLRVTGDTLNAHGITTCHVPDLNLVPAEEWMSRGLCRDLAPDSVDAIFYAEHIANVALARDICAGCPVLAECHEYAIEHDERFGIWAGTTPKQRRRIIEGDTATYRRDGDIAEPRPLRPINHGTDSGYHIHRKRKEVPCDPCRAAHRVKVANDRAKVREAEKWMG